MYSFLTKWGSGTGEIACSSPMLMPGAPLPGGADLELETIRATSDTRDDDGLDETIEATCTATSHGDVGGTVDVDGEDLVLNIGAATTAINDAVVLYKTGRAMQTSTEELPSTEFSRAKRVTSTKRFVGGLVFATLAANTEEANERDLLYSECNGVGTNPPALRGHWRAVQVSTQTREFEGGIQVEPASDGGPNSDGVPAAMVTLTKVCLVLDAHPGVTKCIVSEPQPDTTTPKTSIAIYDGENLHDVVADVSMLESNNFDTETPPVARLFSADTDDFTVAGQLCNF